MSKFFRIMGFEFTSITAKKSWLIPTAIFVVIALVIAFIPQIAGLFGFDGFQSNPEQAPEVGTIEPDFAVVGIYLAGDDIKLEELAQFIPKLEQYSDSDSLERALLSGEVDEAYMIQDADHYTPLIKDSRVYMGQNSPLDRVMRLIREQRFIGDALDFQAYREAMDRPFDNTPKILGTDGQSNYGYTYGLIFVVYFLVIFYGATVATSVAREKSDRTMELLITSADPSKLFFGKVFGAGLAGLIQFSLVVGAAFLGFSINSKAWGFNILRFLQIPPRILLIFLGFTLVGYLLYLFFYAMLGSTVSKVEDVSSASMPIMLLMVVSFLVVNFTMMNPESIVLKSASYIPFSSPIAMFARNSLGSSVADGEVIISFGILLVTTLFTAIISARLYRLGTLSYGNRLKLGEAIKLLREDRK